MSNYKIRKCIHCGKELNRHQRKYCTHHSIVVSLQRSAFGKTLTESQLYHWHGITHV